MSTILEKKSSTAVILEKKTQAFVDSLNNLKGPPLYKLSPDDARQVLENLQQSNPVKGPKTTREDKILETEKGKVSVRIIKPIGKTGILPGIVHIHGGGWILGSKATHAHMDDVIADGTGSVIVFVDYSRSPEAHYPVALEEEYAVLKYVADHGQEFGIDPKHLSLLGDSVGGNMAIVLTLMALERKGPKVESLLVYYPVTDAAMNTPSYTQFSNGPWLTRAAMEWFWNAYAPDVSKRKDPHLSPVNASKEQLQQFPRTLVIVDENDVLRDEGEIFAQKLFEAGADARAVRILGTIHDFVMLNPLADTAPTQLALQLGINFIAKK